MKGYYIIVPQKPFITHQLHKYIRGRSVPSASRSNRRDCTFLTTTTTQSRICHAHILTKPVATSCLYSPSPHPHRHLTSTTSYMYSTQPYTVRVQGSFLRAWFPKVLIIICSYYQATAITQVLTQCPSDSQDEEKTVVWPAFKNQLSYIFATGNTGNLWVRLFPHTGVSPEINTSQKINK